VIWEPFVLALVLGIIVSAGLYFAYLWPLVEPVDEEPEAALPASATAASSPVTDPSDHPTATSSTRATAATDDAADPPRVAATNDVTNDAPTTGGAPSPAP
jgi:cytoskeletal protein RodZ